jgi:hypothetical protein
VGPATLAALADPRQPVETFTARGWRVDSAAAPTPEAALAVRAAVAQIGLREDPPGSNGGPAILKFGQQWDKAAGRYEPWCAYFVSWCWAQNSGGSPFGVRASALKLHGYAKANGRLVAPGDPVLPGDIGILLRSGGKGHAELVVAREFDGVVPCVGGNVSNACRGTAGPRARFPHYFRPR